MVCRAFLVAGSAWVWFPCSCIFFHMLAFGGDITFHVPSDNFWYWGGSRANYSQMNFHYEFFIILPSKEGETNCPVSLTWDSKSLTFSNADPRPLMTSALPPDCPLTHTSLKGMLPVCNLIFKFLFDYFIFSLKCALMLNENSVVVPSNLSWLLSA